MSTRETAGKIYSDLKAKHQDKAEVPEFTRAIGDDFMPKLVELTKINKSRNDRDFYIEVCFRMNSVMTDVPEYYMVSRHTCPTPFPDRAVFHYDRRKDDLVFLWHVPSLQECDYYINNLLSLRPDEREAAQHVLDYRDGTLLRKAKKLNGEVNDYELTFFRKDLNGRPIAS